MKTFSHLSVRQAIEAQLLNRGNPYDALTAEQRDTQTQLAQVTPNDGGLVVAFAGREHRDLTATGQTAVPGDQGGHLIGTDVPEIGPALRSALRLPGLGARTLLGLTGTANLPYGLGSISAEWLDENEAATDVAEALGVLSLSPKRVTASVPVSTQLILQGGAAFDLWLNGELLSLLATEIERVAVVGSSASKQPVGILNTVGIGSVAGGTNGAAPDLVDLCDLEYAVTGTGKADRGPTGWLLSPLVRRKLRRTFANGTGSQSLWPLDSADRLLGHAAGVTGAVPDNLTKGSASGVCSAIIFGNFSELFLGLWGAGIVFEVVRSRQLAIEGKVLIVAGVYVDCGVRNPAAFAAMKDALCAG